MAKRVLVIDDDPSVLRFLSLALEENGYEPLCAEDGMEGLDKVKSEKPDLIILDVMMPQRTRFVLFRQLRNDSEYKDIPVMMVTAGSIRDTCAAFNRDPEICMLSSTSLRRNARSSAEASGSGRRPLLNRR